MTSDDGNTALIVALGVGFLLGYFLSLITRSAIHRARSRRRRPQARSRTRRDLRRAPGSKPAATKVLGGSTSGTAGACALRLDVSDLTPDGKRSDSPSTVVRCKLSSQIELTLASNGPAQGDTRPSEAGRNS